MKTKLLHQTGYNLTWNIQSYKEDKTGDGFIFSPKHISKYELENISSEIKEKSFFDPQLYRFKINRGKLKTYNYCLANKFTDIDTSDLEENKTQIAEKCVEFQINNKFEYVVFPTIYPEDYQNDYLLRLESNFSTPFLKQIQTYDSKHKVLQTIIIKKNDIMIEDNLNKLLTTLTRLNVNGFYIIFESSATSKQIKDPKYLMNALIIIFQLRKNGFEVHVGYTNGESLVYSIAGPNSITMGSYENLRKFNIINFENTEREIRGPRPRIYSDALIQWIDHGYKDAIIALFPNWELVFCSTKYRVLMFNPDFQWHFQKSQLYKHYFLLYSNQIRNLPDNLKERENHVLSKLQEALRLSEQLKDVVTLDENSDGSHLPHWINSIKMFDKYLKDNQYEL